MNMDEFKRVAVLMQGKKVRFEVQHTEYTCVGNIDEGETECNEDMGNFKMVYTLSQVYLTPPSKDFPPQPYLFLCAAEAGPRIIVPSHYSYISSNELACSCVTQKFALKSVLLNHGGLETELPREWGAYPSVFDGYCRLYGTGSIPEVNPALHPEIYPRYPALGRIGCSYNEDLHALTGDIGRLVEGLVPMFGDDGLK